MSMAIGEQHGVGIHLRPDGSIDAPGIDHEPTRSRPPNSDGWRGRHRWRQSPRAMNAPLGAMRAKAAPAALPAVLRPRIVGAQAPAFNQTRPENASSGSGDHDVHRQISSGSVDRVHPGPWPARRSNRRRRRKGAVPGAARALGAGRALFRPRPRRRRDRQRGGVPGLLGRSCHAALSGRPERRRCRRSVQRRRARSCANRPSC